MFHIKLRREIEEDENPPQELHKFITPGSIVSSQSGYMRGHGTRIDEEDKIWATVAGNIEQINRLVSVKPLKSRYNGEVGDVVVGRIAEVQHKRWCVDVNARLNAILMLSSVNLPGGELRRKTEEDELMMRHYLEVGDLISAEVKSVFSDGSLSLHTRSLKYGKLAQGQLVKVPSYLVQRTKTHFHDIEGVQLIMSNNGYIWLCPAPSEDVETGGYVQNMELVPTEVRETMARLRNCILGLMNHHKQLTHTVILHAYNSSFDFTTEVKDLLKTEVIKNVVNSVMQKMNSEGK